MPTENDTRRWLAVILGSSEDSQALSPLLVMLGDPDRLVRLAVVEALGRLGERQAVAPLVAKLEEPEIHDRIAVVEALGRLGGTQAVDELVRLLEHPDRQVTAACALAVLGVDRGTRALGEFLDHPSPGTRIAAVRQLVKMRGRPTERALLSRHSDGLGRWMDPSEPTSATHIEAAARDLGITTREARSLYESGAADFHLKFG